MCSQDKGNGDLLYEHPQTGVYVEEEELTICQHCDNGTQHLSNYVAQECDYCNGTGEIEDDYEQRAHAAFANQHLK